MPNPSLKNLKYLYWKQKLSSPRIAKIQQRSPEYIRYLLRKYKIPIRTKSAARQLLFDIRISKSKLSHLYQDKKLSSPRIAREFNCSAGFIRQKLRNYGIPIRPLSEALALVNKSRYPQKDFGGGLAERAYLLGLSKGDLWVYSASNLSSSIFIQTNSTKSEFINIVENCFSLYGYIRKSKPAKNGAVCIRCTLNRSFNFLLEEKDYITSWILDNTNFFAAFLAGYTDAEGTFCITKVRDRGVFSIRSQDNNILNGIYNKLLHLGILLSHPYLVRRKGTKDIRGTVSNKDIWGIFIHRKESLMKLIDLVDPHLKHRQKRESMEAVKRNIISRNEKYNNRQDRRWCKLYPQHTSYVRP